MVDWIGHDDGQSKNPRHIEAFLSEKIQSAQVTLLGEIDLSEPANYGGNDWSLSELAEYLIEKPIIKQEISHASAFKISYPATIAIWAVFQAQSSMDGSHLWTNLEGYSQAHQIKFAKAFSDAISILGLESFENELQDTQRHLMLARIHSMIPNFAVERYVALIKRAVKFHWPAENVFQEIQRAPDISEAVKKLFVAKPEIGLDLIRRSLQSTIYGGQFGLPTRLIEKLSMSTDGRSKQKQMVTPIIVFNESFCEFELRGSSGWSIEIDGFDGYSGGALPPANIKVSRGGNPAFQILNYDRGFLLFEADGQQIEGSKLPNGPGFIAWVQGVEILDQALAQEAWPIYSWPDWQYSYFEDLKHLVVRDIKGNLHGFTATKSLQIATSTVPFLIFGDDHLPVFNSWPVLGADQVAHLTDNSSGESYKLSIEGEELEIDTGFNIDFTVTGGLGLSEHFRGLVIPGLNVIGLDRPLLSGETREVEFSFPEDWHILGNHTDLKSDSNSITVDSTQAPLLPWIRIKSPDGEIHNVGIALQVLTWSLEYRGEEPLILAREIIQDIRLLPNLQALVLHNIHQRVPRLLVRNGRVDSENVRVQPGVARGADARYDLRSLSNSSVDPETFLCLTWNNATLVLASFRKQVHGARKKMTTVSQKDLLEAVLHSEMFFSQEEWDTFQRESRAESDTLKARARRFRGA
jgi:hypothetical protein